MYYDTQSVTEVVYFYQWGTKSYTIKSQILFGFSLPITNGYGKFDQFRRLNFEVD
jgi:hypothetical protein